MNNDELRQLQELALTEADIERRTLRRKRGVYSTPYGELIEAAEYERLPPNAGVSAEVTDHFVLLFREVFAEHPLRWVGTKNGEYTDLRESKIDIRSVFQQTPEGNNGALPSLEIGAFLGSRMQLGIGDLGHWSFTDGTRTRTLMNIVMVTIRVSASSSGSATILGDLVADMIVTHQHDFLRGRLQFIGVPNIAYNIDAARAEQMGFLPGAEEVSAILQFPTYVVRSSLSTPKDGAGRYAEQIVLGLSSDEERDPLIDGTLYRAVHQIDNEAVVAVLSDPGESES